MKSNRILLLLLTALMFCAIQSNAQTLTMKNGKFHHSNGYVFEKKQLPFVFKDYPKAQYLLDQHHKLSDRGMMLTAISSLSFIGAGISNAQTKDEFLNYTPAALFLAGTLTGVIAIANFTSSNRRMKESIDVYNERNSLSIPEDPILSLELGIKGNSLGLTYTF